MNYSDLEAYLTKQFATDELNLDGFLLKIESRFNAEIFGSKDLIRVTMEEGQDTDGSPTGYYALPGSWRKALKVGLNGVAGQFITPHQASGGTSCLGANNYTIYGRQLQAVPGTAVEADYYSKIDALTPSQNNWLADDHPGVYLAGCDYEASLFLYEETRIQEFKQRYEQAIQQVQDALWDERYTGPLAMRSA